MSFRLKPGVGSGRGGAGCHAGIRVIEFFISIEVWIEEPTCKPIYGQRHLGEKRIVHSPAMIGATDPLPSRGVPLKISNHLLGSSPAQFEPSQTTVGKRRSPKV